MHLLELTSQVNQLSLKRRALHRFRMYNQHQRRKAVNQQLAASHRIKQVGSLNKSSHSCSNKPIVIDILVAYLGLSWFYCTYLSSCCVLGVCGCEGVSIVRRWRWAHRPEWPKLTSPPWSPGRCWLPGCSTPIIADKGTNCTEWQMNSLRLMLCHG